MIYWSDCGFAVPESPAAQSVGSEWAAGTGGRQLSTLFPDAMCWPSIVERNWQLSWSDNTPDHNDITQTAKYCYVSASRTYRQ